MKTIMPSVIPQRRHQSKWKLSCLQSSLSTIINLNENFFALQNCLYLKVGVYINGLYFRKPKMILLDSHPTTPSSIYMKTIMPSVTPQHLHQSKWKLSCLQSSHNTVINLNENYLAFSHPTTPSSILMKTIMPSVIPQHHHQSKWKLSCLQSSHNTVINLYENYHAFSHPTTPSSI